MESQLAAKRVASPSAVNGQPHCESGRAGNSSKRCRQLLPDDQCAYTSKSCSRAQLNTGLRRAQSAPIDDLELQTCNDLEFWRSREVTRRPCPDKIGNVQLEVTPIMRTMLVDWLGEVRDEFRLHTETLFLAVAYLDSFLSARLVSRGRFQLLGLACLWVAAKFEEVYPPPLTAMLAMAENMYSAEDLRAMEKEVLFTLDFGLSVPTALRFLHYLLQLSPLPAHPADALSARRLAEALLELTLLDTAFLRVRPSQVAASAVYLSLGLLRHHEGLPDVVALSGTDPETFSKLVKRLSHVLNDAARQPQPCAMLFRYKAWEALYRRRTFAGCDPVPATATAAAATTTAVSSAPTIHAGQCKGTTPDLMHLTAGHMRGAAKATSRADQQAAPTAVAARAATVSASATAGLQTPDVAVVSTSARRTEDMNLRTPQRQKATPAAVLAASPGLMVMAVAVAAVEAASPGVHKKRHHHHHHHHQGALMASSGGGRGGGGGGSDRDRCVLSLPPMGSLTLTTTAAC